MIEAGEVGAVFSVIDRASPALRAIAEQLLKIDSAVLKAKEGLTALASTRFGGLNERILGIEGNLGKVGNQAARVGNELSAGFGRATNSIEKAASASVTGVERAQAQIARLTQELRTAGATAGEIGGALALGGAGGGRGGRGGSGSGGGSGGGQGRGAGGGGHGGGNGIHFRGHGFGVPGGHVNIGAGADAFMAFIAASAAAHAVKDLFHAGGELEHYKAQALAGGMSQEDLARSVDAAWNNIATNRNASVVEGMKSVLELRQATGSTDDAINMLPAFTRTQNALSSIKDEGVKAKVGSGKQSYNFARSLELLGVTTDPEKLSSYAGSMTREMVGMRGLVDGNTFMQGVQNAGGSRYGWNEDFVGHVLGPLLQMSPRNGTGLYQLDRSFGQGVMTEMMSQGLEKYGLFNKGDEARIDGTFKGMKPGSIQNYDQMAANPAQWAVETVLPALKAHSVNIDDTNAMRLAVNEISRGNKNLNNILDELLLPLNRQLLAKERSNIDAVPKDATNLLGDKDPNLATQAFTTAWHNLMVALGDPMMDSAVKALNSMADGLNKLAGLANVHPEAVKLLGEAAVGLGGAFAVLAGTAVVGALAMFLPGGVAAVGVAALGGVLTSLALFNWESLSKGAGEYGKFLADSAKNQPPVDLKWANDLAAKASAAFQDIAVKIGAELSALGGKITGIAAMGADLAAKIGAAIASIPGQVMGAIQAMAAGIAGAIGSALSGIAAKIGGMLHLGAPAGGGAGTGEAGGGAFTPGAYHPRGGSGNTVHVTTALNVDGKRMAQVVTRHIVAANTHPRQAPYASAHADYASLDYGFNTG